MKKKNQHMFSLFANNNFIVCYSILATSLFILFDTILTTFSSHRSPDNENNLLN